MRTLLLVTISLMVTLASAQTNRITLKTLLEEMTDRAAYTKWPEASFTCKQFSSYSRDSKTIATRDEDTRFKPETGRDWDKAGLKTMILVIISVQKRIMAAKKM